MNKAALALVIGIVVLLLGGSAGAATTLAEARDPQDVRGRLDILLVRAAQRGGQMVLTVRTAERWGCRYINSDYVTGDDHRSASLRWKLNTNADPYTEHDAFFSCAGKSDFTFGLGGRTYDAWRPDGRTIKVAVPMMRHGLGNRHLELHAISRVDQLRVDGVLFDEEDVAPGLRPHR